MKDFAKSIYVGNAKACNAEVVKDGGKWVVLYAEGTKSKEFDSKEAADKFAKEVGNKKVGNGITKFGLGKYVIADGHKAIVLGEKEERGPNGIPFGWVTIRWVEGPWKGQSDQYYDYDLKKAGNKKVGNASTFDRLDDAVHYASNLTDDALRRLNGTFSATNLISALSKCKQACDDAIKLAQQYDREINK